MKLNIVDATPKLVSQMAGDLREADIQELAATVNMDPDRALMTSYEYSSKCWVVLWEEEPCICFGVAPYDSAKSTGSPWMLATPLIEKMPLSFIRRSKDCIEEMKTGFSILENWVDIRNTVSVKWLKWLGFTLEEPEAHGLNGELFQKFWMRSN